MASFAVSPSSSSKRQRSENKGARSRVKRFTNVRVMIDDKFVARDLWVRGAIDLLLLSPPSPPHPCIHLPACASVRRLIQTVLRYAAHGCLVRQRRVSQCSNTARARRLNTPAYLTPSLRPMWNATTHVTITHTSHALPTSQTPTFTHVSPLDLISTPSA